MYKHNLRIIFSIGCMKCIYYTVRVKITAHWLPRGLAFLVLSGCLVCSYLIVFQILIRWLI